MPLFYMSFFALSRFFVPLLPKPQVCERLATDPSAGAAAMEAVSVRARALGCRWMLTDAAERPAQSEILGRFGIWFELETAFLAGAQDVVDEQAYERAMEELDYASTTDVVAQIKEGLLAAVPSLADWCDRHQRTEHVLGDWLYLCAEGDELVDAIAFVVTEDADIARGEDGPFELQLPSRDVVITNESLSGAIRDAQELIRTGRAPPLR